MLKPGDTAPEFALPDDSDTVRTLASFLGGGPLVLYFYPADFTPGCTAQACTFRDQYDELVQAGASLAGISPQSPSSHAKFRDKHNLPFPLLSDQDKRTIRAFGVAGPLGLFTRRATFLIKPDKTIADVLLADLAIGRHRKFVENIRQSRIGSA